MSRNGHENDLPLRPVETMRASEAIYEQIKGLITSGHLNPGDRLPSERSMMAMLERSRPTIREALRMLERSGFIRTVPGTHGAIVQTLGTSGVEQSLEAILQTSRVSLGELAEYRLHNETAVARWAAQRHTSQDLVALERVLDQSEALLRFGELDDFAKLDSTFHGLLAKAGQNDVAYIVSQVLSNIVERVTSRSSSQYSGVQRGEMCAHILEMHRAILSAVRSGDTDAAQAAMARHIQAFMDDLRE